MTGDGAELCVSGFALHGTVRATVLMADAIFGCARGGMCRPPPP